MTSATVVYRSHTGTTRRMAEEIATHLRARSVETRVGSVGELDPVEAAASDFLLLGCWTSGLLVVGQHPDAPWVDFAQRLPSLTRQRVVLFATYKVATGSMFARMRRALAGSGAQVVLELRSRGGKLHDRDRRALDALIGAPGPG